MIEKISVVGSGTAGLINALVLKQIFANTQVDVVSSGDIPIIGVGEGSTEHWSTFEKLVNIDRASMVSKTEATFKFGIRFDGWTNHTPDYFHSISGGQSFHSTFVGTYNWAHANDKQLTPTFGSPSLVKNLVSDMGGETLSQTNQFHFDTFLLNDFLKEECRRAGVVFTDGIVVDLERDATSGDIVGLILEGHEKSLETDFVVDASGFRRDIIRRLGNPRWLSYEDYLPTNSAVVFQTPEDTESGIKPYTLAKAMKAGWMWEIPTQTRRGNGYVFSSNHISESEAIQEASESSGFEVSDTARVINFDPGRLDITWLHNCVAVGLASNFVEPLEATSIAASINQARLLTSYIPAYSHNAEIVRSEYNRIFDSMMDNLLAMIAMHYVSDRDDTPMWSEQQSGPKPELLSHLIDIMKFRGLEDHDIPNTGFELFRSFHFWHVAQGQGLINKEACQRNLDMRGTSAYLRREVSDIIRGNRELTFVSHKEALLKGQTCG
jgi:tryptophan 7-halogenase